MTNGTTIPIGDPRRLAAYAEIEAMVAEHGEVEFIVHGSASRPPFVCGWIRRAASGGFHARCIGATVSHTIHPVSAERIGVAVDVLLADFGWTVLDAAFKPDGASWAGGEARPATARIAYFIQDGDGPIKIGETSRGGAEGRMANLQTGNPRRLTLLATTAEHSEKALHSRFAADRISGEWFHPSAALVAFIEELR